jgi:hypothetical protein
LISYYTQFAFYISTMYIHYITPFRSDKNIGRAYNEACATAPEGSWICLRDPDTMFLQPDSQSLIEQIIASNPPFGLIGCLTNRLRGGHQRVTGMFEKKDLLGHMSLASVFRDNNNIEIEPTDQPIAGMFMLFKKELWNSIKFDESAGRYTDQVFSAEVLSNGGKLGVAQGLYLFHLYRWGSKHQFNDINHLL